VDEGTARVLKITHIVPGLDPGASPTLQYEHLRALESISKAAIHSSKSDLELRVIEVCDPSWTPVITPGVEVYRHEIDYISVSEKLGIRPKLRSFFPDPLTSNTDFIVFTNADICVTIDFYEKIQEIVDKGTLAGSIHRRTVLGVVPSDPRSVDKAIMSENWYLHPGSDCYFFPAKTAAALRVSEVVMGIPPVGRLTLLTISAVNPSFKKFPTLGTTFHFGDDRVWQTSGRLRKLREMNFQSWYLAVPRLISIVGFEGFIRGMRTIGFFNLRNWGSFVFSALRARISRGS
jgi:hypothetical protein